MTRFFWQECLKIQGFVRIYFNKTWLIDTFKAKFKVGFTFKVKTLLEIVLQQKLIKIEN